METETVQAQTTSPSKKERDATVEAVNHLIQGKRHLLVQDYSSAVNSLEQACSLLAACYGDAASECADAYFYYGRALLELSRKESGIFGNSKDESGGEEDEDEDEEDDDEENDNANEAEKDEDEESEEESKNSDDSEDLEESKKADEETVAAEAVAKEQATEEIDETVGSSSDKQSEPIKAESSTDVAAAGDLEQPSTSSAFDDPQPGPSGEQKVSADGEEVTNLQLAWEVLELAKVILKKQPDNSRDQQLRLAQVYSKLGEVAMESENYPQSIEDLHECLKLQLPLLKIDDRQLAETYYQLGLAYSFAHDFESAINAFQEAINTINSRIENLTKIVETNAPPTADGEDPVFHAKLELEELQELLPELREKITDTIDLKKNTVKIAEELNKDFAPVVEELSNASTISPVKENKPVTNIGHLVRKKRKPEENSCGSANSEGNLSKKTKVDDSSIDKVSSTIVTCNSESHINGKQPEDCLSVVNSKASGVACTEG